MGMVLSFVAAGAALLLLLAILVTLLLVLKELRGFRFDEDAALLIAWEHREDARTYRAIAAHYFAARASLANDRAAALLARKFGLKLTSSRYPDQPEGAT